MFDFEKAKEKLQTMLKPERYTHSLGVMETAIKLARIHGCNEEKAKIAGLLHDCAKNFTFEDQFAMCAQYDIELDTITQASPKVLHQILGAEIARRDFGISDPQILSAIACHTTGKAQMGLLDKILYLADYTEPNREEFEGLERMRELTMLDLDEAMLFALDVTVKSVLQRNMLLHPDTVAARNWLLMEKM